MSHEAPGCGVVAEYLLGSDECRAWCERRQWPISPHYPVGVVVMRVLRRSKLRKFIRVVPTEWPRPRVVLENSKERTISGDAVLIIGRHFAWDATGTRSTCKQIDETPKDKRFKEALEMKEGVKLEWVTVPDSYFRLGIERPPRACPCYNMTTL
jgi:hypothetical protein